MLTRAIDTASHWLSSTLQSTKSGVLHKNPPKLPQRFPCLDVVIPTYRCDPGMLRALMSLRCTDAVSLNTIVVVDRPDAATMEDIKALESYETDRVVCPSVNPPPPLSVAVHSTWSLI